MNKKELGDEDIVNLFIPRKNVQDNLLATAATGMVIGCIVLIGIAPSLSQAVRIALTTSVSSLTISLLLLLWYKPRLETRSELMRKIAENRVQKLKSDIEKFTKLFYEPLFKASLINNLQVLLTNKFNSKKVFEEAIRKATNRAEEDADSQENRKFTAEIFYKDFLKDMFFMDEKVFHTPLDEDYSRIKHFLDIFSFKFRYHFFVIGVVALSFSIIMHLLLK